MLHKLALGPHCFCLGHVITGSEMRVRGSRCLCWTQTTGHTDKGCFSQCHLRKGEAGAETAAKQAGITSTASQQPEQSRSSNSNCLQPRAKIGRQVCRDEAGLNSSQEGKPVRVRTHISEVFGQA